MPADESVSRCVAGVAVAPGSSRSNAAAMRVSDLLAAVAAAAAPDVAVRCKGLAVETRPATDGTPGWPVGFSRMSPDRDYSATHTYPDQLTSNFPTSGASG